MKTRKDSGLCYLCSSRFDHLYDVTGSDKIKYRVVECRDCKLRTLDPIPPQDYIKSLYDIDCTGFNHDTGEVMSSHFLTGLKKRIIIDPLFRWIKSEINFDKNYRLLDIGCATGWITSIAREHGFDPTGLEANADLAGIAETKYNINVINGFLEELTINEKYDVITMFHVLEHLVSPIKELTRIREHLSVRDGVLMVVVPNGYSFGVSFFKEFYNWNILNHISFFSGRSLKYILHRSGFRNVHIRHVISPPILWYSMRNYFISNGGFNYINFILNNAVLSNAICTPISLVAKWLNRGEVIAAIAKC